MSVNVTNLWSCRLALYKTADNRRAFFETMVTGVPFITLWVFIPVLADRSFSLPLSLALPAGAHLVRLFMVQHDCGIYAFFSSRKANDWTGKPSAF